MFMTMMFLIIEMALEFMFVRIYQFIMIHQCVMIDHYLMYFNQISQ